MRSVEEKVRALRAWQSEGEQLWLDMTHSLAELSQRMASAEGECRRLRGEEGEGGLLHRPPPHNSLPLSQTNMTAALP